MSQPSWQVQLRLVIAQIAEAVPPGNLSVVGVGNELDGDDAIGSLVIKALQSRKSRSVRSRHIQLIDTGPSPESFSGKLRQFHPDQIILIDAARMGDEPGEIQWLDWENTGGFSASSHSLPLSIFATYLIHELGCEVALLGIEPQSVEPGQPLSNPVRLARNRIVRCLRIAFSLFVPGGDIEDSSI
jgi:hydrogenase 3 maturation protease